MKLTTLTSILPFRKETMTKVRKAVIPAAGLRTFLPATKALARSVPIVDKPTIQFIVEKQRNLDWGNPLSCGKAKRSIEPSFRF